MNLKSKDIILFVFCDSLSAKDLVMNQNSYYRRTKHIEINFHYIRDTIEKAKMILDKVHTSNNLRDMWTKPLATLKFEHCSNLIGCYDVCREYLPLREMHLLGGGYILDWMGILGYTLY